jgi:uncharacterized membrane protein
MKITLGCLLFFAYLLVISIPISAQQTTISVAPAILDLAVLPGEKLISNLTIRNGGDVGLPISIEPKSLLLDKDVLPNNNQKKSDASDWIEVTEKEFLLVSKQSKKVPIYIDVPKDATPGGHYAQISIRGLSLESTNISGTSIVVPEIAVTVLITVSGDIITDMNFEKSNILPFFVTPNTNYHARFKVVNNGNIHDLITPTLVINKDGEELSRQAMTTKIVLPQTTKEFSETLKLPENYGKYEYFVEFKYANGQILQSSEPQLLVVSRPLRLLFIIAFSTISLLYLYHHRKNVLKSWYILIGKKP